MLDTIASETTSSADAPADSNPVATITNNSGVAVDIYDVYNPTDNSDAVLTFQKLGSIASGETKDIQTIHLASQLQAMFTGTVAALNGNYYYQFPVAVMPIVNIGSRKITSHTITADEKTGMEQSFLFQKYVSANPDSQFAKDFIAALGNADQETAVNAFFASTKNFKLCSLAAWTAIMTWCSQFTSAWQGTYYLYSVPAQGSTALPQLTATVNITSTSDTNSATLTMNNSSQSTTLVMNGSGMEESDVGQGGISVSLKETWINVIQTTTASDGTVNTNYLIGAALAGTINGINVSGTGEQRAIPSSNDPDKQTQQQQSATSFNSIFPTVATLVGLAISALTAYLFYKQLKQESGQKSNKAAEQAARQPGADDAAVDAAIGEVDRGYREDVRSAAARNSAVVASAEARVPLLRDQIAQRSQFDALAGAVNVQADRVIDVLAERPPNARTEGIVADLSNLQRDMQDRGAAPSAADVANISERLGSINADIRIEAQRPGIRQSEAAVLDRARDAMQDARRAQESIQDANERAAERASESAAQSDVKPEDAAPEPKPAEPIVDG